MPLITFEGVEGCGKSTQLRLAAARLRETGHETVETREPGGTAIGQKIRAIVMDVENRDLDPVAEWLLLEADRRQHVRQTLRPALDRGAFVLSDRYADSTEAYQQQGRGIDGRLVGSVDHLAREGLVPDLTLLYDIEPSTGLERAERRDGSTGRFEGAGLDFHRRVRNAFLEIARREPERVRVVAAADAAELVFSKTWEQIARRFEL